MKPIPVTLFIAITLACAATSCKKKHPLITHTDIYITGNTAKNSPSKILGEESFIATYWKNGVPTLLPTDSLKNSNVNSIATDGKNVYVAGDMAEPSTSSRTGVVTATYWKNGVAIKMGQGTIYGVAIHGKDVYLVGTVYILNEDKLAIWKNGILDTLGNGRILSIAIDGDDIYMAGYRMVNDKNEDVKTGWRVAAYWKNNKIISPDNTAINTVSNSIFINDGDIYVAGSQHEKAEVPLYWKNRDTISLSPKHTRLYGSADGIYADDDNIYSAGYVYIPTYKGFATFGAAYWKNGTVKLLPFKGRQSFASAIAVVNNDVYVAGQDDYPVYWKNSKRMQLGNVKGQAFGMLLSSY